MDDRFGWSAALLVGMLVVGGGLGFLGGMAANDAPAAVGDGDDSEEPTDTNDAPLLSIDDAVHGYGVTAFTVHGLVGDEDASNVAIHVEMVDPINETNRQGPFTFHAASDGKWSGVLPIGQPGEWVLIASATDAEGAISDSAYASAVMPLPNEPAPALTMTFVEPVDNSVWANILGGIEHTYPSTCTVVYTPQGQSDLDGEVTNSQFSIPLDYNATNRAGEVVADCGLFTMTRTVVTYAIPELYPEDPEVPDADRDGFSDDEDDCDDTPEGEPVHPDGCSDSQRDADGDGVSDAEDRCEGHNDNVDVDADGIVDGCDSLIDSDNDGVADADDTCPDTPAGAEVDANGCEIQTADPYDPFDSWVCQGSGVGPIYDLNDQYGYQANSNDPFTCVTTVRLNGEDMEVWSNGIPNHDFTSTRGCCTDEVDYDWTFPLVTTEDTDGSHETVPERGAVAVAVNGVPIFGPEDGPGGDAVALHHHYYDEDRQAIELGICGGHSAGTTYHYHWDANCILWTPGDGEDMTDYDWTKIDSTVHSGIIGWSFDGYPIYGMYGWNTAGVVIPMESSYQLTESGRDGYDGTDDWEYIDGMSRLDECNGIFSPTPEYPEGIYHYVSTPLSASPDTHVDTDGNTVPMIGFPYFQMCYHGDATGGPKGSAGQGPPPRASGEVAPLHSMEMPGLSGLMQGLVWLAILIALTRWNSSQNER